MGWTGGVDQYDEGNPIGQAWLNRYAARYNGSRPEYCVTVVNHDVAATLVRAFADSHPLSPRGGVKEALERVKMMPAASGAPGTACRWVNGRGARGWEPATWWRARSIPTASTHTWSIASARRTDFDDNAGIRAHTATDGNPPRAGPNWAE